MKKAEFVVAEASFALIDGSNSKFLERSYTKGFLEKYSRWGYPQFVATKQISGKSKDYQRADGKLVIKSEVSWNQNFPELDEQNIKISDHIQLLQHCLFNGHEFLLKTIK